MVERIIPTSPHPEETASGAWLRTLLYGIAALILGVAGVVLFYAVLQEEQKFAGIYARLGIEPLPKGVENMPYIKADLVKLQDGPCDKYNVEALAQSLDTLGQKAFAQNVRQGYNANCTRAVHVDGFEATLDNLGINGADAEIRRLARQVRGSLCNYPSLKELIAKLQKNSDHQPVTQLGEGYLARCSRNVMVGYWTMQSYYQLGAFPRSLALVQEFERVEPNDPYWPYWKGRNLTQLGRLAEAADAHVRSLGLWSNPANVVMNDFWVTSQALKAAGRTCEAIRPLEQYVSYDPVNRLSPDMQKELTALAQLGNCP